jgi:hypothetical protein
MWRASTVITREIEMSQPDWGRGCRFGMISALLVVGLAFDPGSAIGSALAAAAPQPSAAASPVAQAAEPSLQEKMQRRFPQPIRAGDLIGLPVLDDDDITIGQVRHVVKSPDGHVRLIVTYGGWFGFGQRLVAVPIEAVAILGRQIAALEMPREDFARAPTWSEADGQKIPPDDRIRIAITRR